MVEIALEKAPVTRGEVQLFSTSRKEGGRDLPIFFFPRQAFRAKATRNDPLSISRRQIILMFIAARRYNGTRQAHNLANYARSCFKISQEIR